MGKMLWFSPADRRAGRVPLHNLEGIVTFGYTGASPALMGYCAQKEYPCIFSAKAADSWQRYVEIPGAMSLSERLSTEFLRITARG